MSCTVSPIFLLLSAWILASSRRAESYTLSAQRNGENEMHFDETDRLSELVKLGIEFLDLLSRGDYASQQKIVRQCEDNTNTNKKAELTKLPRCNRDSTRRLTMMSRMWWRCCLNVLRCISVSSTGALLVRRRRCCCRRCR